MAKARRTTIAKHIFDDILLKGVKSGEMPARTEGARKWYRQKAKTYGKGVKENAIMRDPDRLTSRPYVGSMYMFYYDPKHKKTLPYYDSFPLIFPFSTEKGNFKGINLHYLPLPYRAKLMDALYNLRTDSSYDDNTRLKMNYNILKSAAKYRFFKPCVKMYLTSHTRSRFLFVHPSEWDIALFLPSERFVKQTKTVVWRDSRKALSLSGV